MIVRKKSLNIAIVVFVVLTGKLLAADGNISLEAKVDKNKIRIGDLIQYSIIVTRDKNVNIEMPNLGANLGGFEIHDYDDPEPVRRNGEIIQRREYVISTYDIGDYEIPPVTVRFSLGEDSTWQELTTEKIKISVESVKPSEAGDIRDIKPPLEIERDWMRIIRFAAAGLIIVLIAILILVYIRRRRAGKSFIPHREKPKRPPHEIALDELDRLLREKLLDKGEIKQFYIRISETIRHYIEGRFFINAIEMTTMQLIDSMKDAEVEDENVQIVEDFLMQCDLVKFAKYIPTQAEHQQVIDRAYRIVNQTKIIIEPESEFAAVEQAESQKDAEVMEMEMTPGEAELVEKGVNE